MAKLCRMRPFSRRARPEGRMLAVQLAAAIGAARPSQLDDLARTLWRGHTAGLLVDEEAQRLAEAIEAHRPSRSSSPVPSWPRGSLFAPRREQPARQHPARIGRRRRLASSGPLPPSLAAEWTTGELAVLRIVGDEVREAGICDRSLAEIAARAGVCRSLAQVTLRRAARVGLVAIEERRRQGAKNLTNVVRVVSGEWRTWLDRGPRIRDAADAAGLPRTGSRNPTPTDTASSPNGQTRAPRHRHLGFGGRWKPGSPPPRPR